MGGMSNKHTRSVDNSCQVLVIGDISITEVNVIQYLLAQLIL